ncbi:hypothetical protein AB0H28_26905 [Micromonospora sp. NPDC050980]|uniref:hypothetical protein n=1 Tax=Micromonospora sp. NPDC050980 TaxID=3155161 RepID=UPI00340271E3
MWDDVYSLRMHESGAWLVRLYAADGPVEVLPDGDSGIAPANAWTDDPIYGPQHVIPAGLETRCRRPYCHGTAKPIAGTDHFDADGTATIDTRCDACGLQSTAMWQWQIAGPPVEDVEIIREGFVYERCPMCGGDFDDHDIVTDPLGHALAMCRSELTDDTAVPASTTPTPTPSTANSKELTVNLEATGPEEIRAAFTQAAEAAGENAEMTNGIAGVMTEAADRYEGLDMAASTVGHLRDAAEQFAAAGAALNNAQEELQAALADFNSKDGQVAEAVADAGGNVASKEVLVG